MLNAGLTTFSFRPHGGEAGEVDHLVATFLYAESVNHGITMSKNPPLQYLYYLMQVSVRLSWFLMFTCELYCWQWY